MAKAGKRPSKKPTSKAQKVKLTELQARGYHFLLSARNEKSHEVRGAAGMLTGELGQREGLHVYSALLRAGVITKMRTEGAFTVVKVHDLVFETAPNVELKRARRKSKKKRGARASKMSVMKKRGSKTADATMNGSLGAHVTALTTLYGELDEHVAAIKAHGMKVTRLKDGTIALVAAGK